MTYALADCNNFYCSCERVFHPDLVGRPVVVLSNNDGCVIARSNESKVLGLKMGDPFYQVKNLLELNDVAVFSSNYNLYGDMSKRVMSMLSRYTPHLEIYSIDEAFLDMTGVENADEYCRDMVRRVHKGVGIPISVGIAPTKTLAKVASKFAKKYPGYRGVCSIDTEEKREKALKLFDVEDVWGIGRRHGRRLRAAGIDTAWDFTQRSEAWVKREMSIVGLRTHKELRGIDCVPIDELPHKKSICTSRSFPGVGLDKLGDVEEAVANFAASCSRKLREQHTCAGAMTVFAWTSRFRTDLPSDYIQANFIFEVATNTLHEIVDSAVVTLRRFWKDAGYLYKKAGVIVWDIVRDDCVQGSLFDTVDRERQARLMRAIDEVNHRNGHDSIRTAVQGYGRRWHLKNEHISKQYTTNLDQVITVYVR